MKLDLRGGHVLVVLSRHNVLSLLHKLTVAGVVPTRARGNSNVNGEPTTEMWVVVQVEDDEQHSGAESATSSRMRPSTERALAEERVQRARRAAARPRSNPRPERLH